MKDTSHIQNLILDDLGVYSLVDERIEQRSVLGVPALGRRVAARTSERSLNQPLHKAVDDL